MRQSVIIGILLCAIFTSCSAIAQVDLSQVIGIPQNARTLPIRFGFVNLDNGNLHLEIPLFSISQRGHAPITDTIVYDSTFWNQTLNGSDQYINSPGNVGWQGGGISYGNPPSNALPSGNISQIACTNQPYTSGTIYEYSSFTTTDPHNTSHTFNTGLIYNAQCTYTNPNTDVTTEDPGDSEPTYYGLPQSGSGYANDGSGYFLTVSKGNYWNGETVGSVTAPDGSTAITTPNGNEVWSPNGPAYDDLGSPYPSVNGDITAPVGSTGGGTSCSGAPNITSTVSRPIWDGNSGAESTATYTYTWECIKVGIAAAPYDNGPVYVLASVELPDLSLYKFGYDTNANPWGQLTSITLPSGGVVSYSYTGTYGPWNLGGGQVQSVTDNGGTTQFLYSTPQSSSGIGGIGIDTYYPVTVTSPPHATSAGGSTTISDATVYSITTNSSAQIATFTKQEYSGPVTGTLLRTTTTTLDTYLRPIQTLSVWKATGESHQVNTKYADDSTLPGTMVYGQLGINMVAQQKEYNSGALVRTVNTSYLQDTSTNKYVSTYHMINYPSSVTVLNQSSAVFAQVQYNYDQYTASYCSSNYPKGLSGIAMLTSVTGAPGHDDGGHGVGFTARGNVTSVVYSGSNLSGIATYNCYDTLGNVLQTVDGNGNATRYSYSDSFYDTQCLTSGLTTYALPTKVTNALGQVSKTAYYSCDRNPRAVQGSNDLAASPSRAGTTYSYDTMSRPLCTNTPDGGQTCNQYPSSTEVQTTTLISSAGSDLVYSYTDTYGNPTEKLDYNSGVEVDTTYDAFGRVNSVSNPHQPSGSSSDGITQYAYDALGRTVGVLNPDGTTETSSYSGNTVTVQDENGNQWQRTTDALGRLTKVLEPSGASTAPTLETDYTSYDPLNNLLTLTQKGNGTTDTAVSRSFLYDAASRLISSTNPEVGTTANPSVTYTYDSNGNVTSKTSPAPNATSGTQTIGYCYDALNRPTYKFDSSANCTSPSGYASAYAYDGNQLSGTSVTGVSFTGANAIGLLTDEQQYSGTTLVSERVPTSYDPMGRLLMEQKNPFVPTTTPYSLSYSYNLEGSPLSDSNSLNGLALGYNYNPAGQLSAITTNTTSYGSGTYPATLYTAAYGPVGVTNATYAGDANTTGFFNLYRRYNNRGRVVDNEVYPSTDTFGTASVTITGPASATSSGTVSITAGSVTESVAYQAGATPVSIAQSLAVAFNENQNSQVTAAPSTSAIANSNGQGACTNGTTFGGSSCAAVNLRAVMLGQYSVDVSLSSTTSGSSFTTANSGLALTTGVGSPQGGADAYVYTLTYDHAGNVTAANDPYNGSWNYSYDTLNRLVSAKDNSYQGTRITASGAALTLQCWTYDSFGNRTYELANPSSCPSPGMTPTSFTHRLGYTTSPNRVTSIDGNALQYDAAGNVTQDLINKYVYDQEGRLCAVQNLSVGTSTQYVYDAEGTRVAKGNINSWPTAGSPCAAPTSANGFGTTSLAIWLKSANGGQDTQILPVIGLSATNVPVMNTNVYAGGSLLATYNFTATVIPQGRGTTLEPVLNLSFAFNDWLGTKRLQINSAGQAINTWASDPFGNYLTPGAGGTTDATDRHFTGQERDTESGTGIAGTGNDYFGARYYGSNMGRWMSPDPTGLDYADLTNPQSFNLYSYVLNNPLKFVDPNGLYCAWEDGTSDDDPSDGGASHADCDAQGGHWTDQSNPCHGADGCVATFDWNPPPKPCVQMALRNVIAAGETPGEPNNGYGTVVKGTVISAPASTGIKPGTRNAQIANPSSLTGHPNILVQVGPGLRSTAFGRYQILNGTAKSYGFNDFSPTGQDAAANTLMDKRGMTSAAMKGNIQQAIQNGGREWASLPGSPYGQPTQSMDDALQTYGSSIVSSGCQQQ